MQPLPRRQEKRASTKSRSFSKKSARFEREHEERYRRLLENVKDGKVFAKTEKVVWECSNCGHIYYGEKAPEVCPVCNHPQAYFKINAKNY